MSDRKQALISPANLISFCWLGFLIILYLLQFGASPSAAVVSIRTASWIGLASLAIIIYTWHRIYYRMLAPSFIVVVTLWLVLCGQSIMWAFGLDAGYRDIIQSPQWGLSEAEIVRGLLFSHVCVFTLHFVISMTIDGRTRRTRGTRRHRLGGSLDRRSTYSAILVVAFAIIVICIWPYLLDFAQTYSYEQTHGYDRAYDLISYGFDSLPAKVGAFLPVGVVMLMLCWGRESDLNRENYFWKALACYALVAIVIGSSLALGRRTNIILFAFALLAIWYRDRKMKRSTIAVLFVVCLIGMAGMRLIDMYRSGTVADLSSFFAFFAGSDESPIIDFLGDVGWNLLSTVEVQILIPATKNFSYGITYLASLTSVIPNLGFWAIHPASEYGMASTWLQQTLGLSYGVGFTPVAEAYYNFGVFGPLMFVIWGRFLASLNGLFEDYDNPLSFLVPVIFLGAVAKSFVRSCFAAVFRPAFLYMFIIPLLVYLVARQLQMRRVEANESRHFDLA